MFKGVSAVVFFGIFLAYENEKFELDRTFAFVCLNLNIDRRTIFTIF